MEMGEERLSTDGGERRRRKRGGGGTSPRGQVTV